MTITKKATPLLLLLLFASVTQGQSIEEMIQRAAQQQAGGTRVAFEENKDPFVPLTFTGTMTMEVRTSKGGEPDREGPTTMRMAFSPERMAMAPGSTKDKEEVRMVYDLKNKVTYTLMTDAKGKRTGMKTKMMKVVVEGQEDTPAKEPSMTRTGETKQILGHTCRKFLYEDENGKGEAWIAEQLGFDMMAAMRQMVGDKRAQGWQKTKFEGMLMENAWTSADGRERVTMAVTHLEVGNVNEGLLGTDGYDIQDLSNMPMFGR